MQSKANTLEEKCNVKKKYNCRVNILINQTLCSSSISNFLRRNETRFWTVASPVTRMNFFSSTYKYEIIMSLATASRDSTIRRRKRKMRDDETNVMTANGDNIMTESENKY